MKKIAKLITSELFFNLYYKFRRPQGNRILIYHAFGTKFKHDTYGFSLSPSLFEEHLKFIKDKYRVVPLTTSLADSQETISLTIDDGYKDTIRAFELLEKYQLPFSLFITTGKINCSGYLTDKDIFQMAQHNLCTIGSHTVSHAKLGLLERKKQYREIHDSKKELEEIITSEVNSLSYPHGIYSKITVDIAKKCGCSIACTSRAGINTKNESLYELKRTEITRHDTLRILKKKIDGYYDFPRLK